MCKEKTKTETTPQYLIYDLQILGSHSSLWLADVILLLTLSFSKFFICFISLESAKSVFNNEPASRENM